MGLAEDIKQPKFKSDHQKAGINIIYTFNYLSERMRKHFSKYDLTSQQYNVLRILRGSLPKPLSTLQIRDRMLDKMSDTSRIVDRLVKKELVEKKTCTGDKRLVDVTITDKGMGLLSEMDIAEDFNLENLMEKLTQKEAQELSNLLDKVRG